MVDGDSLKDYKHKGVEEMKTLRKLSDLLEFLEDRGISPEDVVIDRRAVNVIKPSDEEDPDLDEEDWLLGPPAKPTVASWLGGNNKPMDS